MYGNNWNKKLSWYGKDKNGRDTYILMVVKYRKLKDRYKKVYHKNNMIIYIFC